MEIFSSRKEAEEEIFNVIMTDQHTQRTIDAKSAAVKACGDLACQHDSFLKTLTIDDAHIIAWAPYIEQCVEQARTAQQDNHQSKGKGSKDKKKGKGNKSKEAKHQGLGESRSILKFAIVLSDSIFFPTGGGQPCDHGTITFTLKGSHGAGLNEEENDVSIDLLVRDAQNIRQTCILYCQPAAAAASNIDIDVEQMNRMYAPFFLRSPSSLSEENKRRRLSITQNIDWERRFDLMTQHSGQHLCSAVALSQYEIQTHTFSLGEASNSSYIDFVIDQTLSKERAHDVFSMIEERVNQHIRDDMLMTPTWLDPLVEADAVVLREKVRSRLLPKNLTGAIRLVEIKSRGDGDGHGHNDENGEVIDCNTCCGTHVPSLGHLQMIKFFRRERVKPAIMRVHFAAGKRLMRVMEEMHDNQMGITGILSCRDVEQVHRVEQLLEDKRMKEKEMKALKDKLSNFHVTEVVNQCVCVSDNDDGNEASLAVVDLGDVDMSYMTMVANASMEKIDRDGAILVLVGGEDGSDEGSFLLLGNKVVVDQVGKDVAAMFGGRGGGRNGKFQGKGVTLRSALGQVKDFVAKAMKAE